MVWILAAKYSPTLETTRARRLNLDSILPSDVGSVSWQACPLFHTVSIEFLPFSPWVSFLAQAIHVRLLRAVVM